MELRLKERRVRAICYVTFTLTFTETEKAKLDKFGYPSIDMEGEVKTLNQFPYTKSFDGLELGHSEAERLAREYVTLIKGRLKNAWDVFKALPDTFGVETVETI